MTALLNLIYCFLMDMIASFKDIWLLGWDSVLSPVDTLLASVGTGSLVVPVIADQYAWMLGPRACPKPWRFWPGPWGCASFFSPFRLFDGGHKWMS